MKWTGEGGYEPRSWEDPAELTKGPNSSGLSPKVSPEWRTFCCDLIRHSIEDSQREPEDYKKGRLQRRYRKRRRQSVIWLVPRDAREIMDCVGLDQRAVVRAIGWPDMAKKVLEEDDLEPDHEEYLRTALREMR